MRHIEAVPAELTAHLPELLTLRLGHTVGDHTRDKLRLQLLLLLPDEVVLFRLVLLQEECRSYDINVEGKSELFWSYFLHQDLWKDTV